MVIGSSIVGGPGVLNNVADAQVCELDALHGIAVADLAIAKIRAVITIAGTFGLAVRIVQSRLNRRRNHHRAGIAMFFQRGEKRRREPEIASHKLRRVLRTVDTREVEDEIRIPAIGIEFFRRTVQIVS